MTMMTTQTEGKTKVEQAQAAIQAAEAIISQERRTQLENQLRDAIELAGKIKGEIQQRGEYLGKFGREFPDTWNKRALVAAEISSLTSQEFYLPEEIESAQARLEALDQQWSELTARLTEISTLTAGPEHKILNLQVDLKRVMLGIGDLRLALKGGLVGPTNGGTVRPSRM
jgi:chromosome segregation ATPase